MNNINPIYNVNNYYLSAFKQKEADSSIVTNPITTNVTMRGTEALANYNYAQINKNKDFDIPELKPICSLEDMYKVKGERIYNSDGDLVQIVDEKDEYKIIYTPSSENKNIFDIVVYENDEQIKYQVFYRSIDGNNYLAISDYKNHYNTLYKYDNGKLLLNNKDKQYENMVYSYSADKDEYEYYDAKTKKIYDKNLNLKTTIDYTTENQNTRINYWNGRPISKETRIYENEKNIDDGIDPFNDKDLIPAEYYEIGNTKNIEGKKYYYSNGQLEKVLTSDNKTYHYDLSGNFDYLEIGNKEIAYCGDENYIAINEKINDNCTKTTYYDDKKLSSVDFLNNDKNKYISWDSDGKITYQQCDDGYSVLQKTYNNKKELLDKMVWYYDDNN